MYYIDFNAITDEHLEGEWRVHNRTFNRSDVESIFAKAEKHSFLKDGVFKLSPSDVIGQWSIKRNDDLVRRPFLSFEVGSEKAEALITRLSYTPDKSKCQLNIYFSTGLELVLLKELVKD
ncbi:MAG TPA: hypothetical protein VEC36_01285 [Patescibacteria group bacterium]|nr:hypothetical protein [Patescibacteria group bacterium]